MGLLDGDYGSYNNASSVAMFRQQEMEREMAYRKAMQTSAQNYYSQTLNAAQAQALGIVTQEQKPTNKRKQLLLLTKTV